MIGNVLQILLALVTILLSDFGLKTLAESKVLYEMKPMRLVSLWFCHVCCIYYHLTESKLDFVAKHSFAPACRGPCFCVSTRQLFQPRNLHPVLALCSGMSSSRCSKCKSAPCKCKNDSLVCFSDCVRMLHVARLSCSSAWLLVALSQLLQWVPHQAIDAGFMLFAQELVSCWARTLPIPRRQQRRPPRLRSVSRVCYRLMGSSFDLEPF